MIGRHGATAVHLGLKIKGCSWTSYGSHPTFDKISGRAIDDFKQFNDTDIEIDLAMTTTDILAAQRESFRRRQVRRILEKLENTREKDTDEEGDTVMTTDEQSSGSSSHSSSGSDDNSSEISSDTFSEVFCPPCSRFDEIRHWLFSKRTELALDSLHFGLPEHLFHIYILREGGLAITPVECRKFLLQCDWREELFK